MSITPRVILGDGEVRMRELAYLVAVPFASLTGLVAFETWWSAALYAALIGLIATVAVRRQEKHHRPQVYDDSCLLRGWLQPGTGW
jgi:hypothetical protein